MDRATATAPAPPAIDHAQAAVLPVQLLLLIIVANGGPILAKRLMGSRLDYPIDGGRRLNDGRRLLGRSKTWRGVAAAFFAATAAAVLLGLDWRAGPLTAAGAMTGDLLSSFTKRRLGLESGAQSVGIDQIPESLLPLLLLTALYPLSAVDVAGITVAFFVAELALSKLLFRLRIRERPY